MPMMRRRSNGAIDPDFQHLFRAAAADPRRRRGCVALARVPGRSETPDKTRVRDGNGG
jgi:hypothetical protein